MIHPVGPYIPPHAPEQKENVALSIIATEDGAIVYAENSRPSCRATVLTMGCGALMLAIFLIFKVLFAQGDENTTIE